MKRILHFIATYSRPLTLAALACLLLFPLFVTNAYVLRVAATSLIYVILTLGLNVVTGYMGQTSFGTAAFWGIGAYTGAILSTRIGLGTGLLFLIAPLLSGVIAMLLGMCVLKLRGYYMAIVTLGFCEIVRLIKLNWMSLTRGPLGIMNIPKLSFFGVKVTSSQGVFYVALAMTVLVTYVVWKLMNSRIGLTITAIRDDEIAVQSMGVNVVKYKVGAFALYGMICGLAGAFYAHFMSYIDPTMFKTLNSTEVIIMVIFGGLGSIPGSYLGAIVLTVITELLRDLVEYRMLIYGFLLVILMIVKPEGILGSVNLKHIRQRMQPSGPSEAGEEKEVRHG